MSLEVGLKNQQISVCFQRNKASAAFQIHLLQFLAQRQSDNNSQIAPWVLVCHCR